MGSNYDDPYIMKVYFGTNDNDNEKKKKMKGQKYHYRK